MCQPTGCEDTREGQRAEHSLRTIKTMTFVQVRRFFSDALLLFTLHPRFVFPLSVLTISYSLHVFPRHCLPTCCPLYVGREDAGIWRYSPLCTSL